MNHYNVMIIIEVFGHFFFLSFSAAGVLKTCLNGRKEDLKDFFK